MATSARMLSPALPSELLSYIVTYQEYPTTLVICSPREAFMTALLAETECHESEEGTATSNSNVQGREHDLEDGHPTSREDPAIIPKPKSSSDQAPPTPAAAAPALSLILSAPLYQVAIARHIRTVFVPTVSHLRAFLSVFTGPTDSSSVVLPPPPRQQHSRRRSRPLLVAYGLLDLHRDTSEWSAQGLGCTAAGLVEAADRVGYDTVVVEAPARVTLPSQGDGLDAILAEEVPVLSGSARRLPRPDGRGAGWTGRTVPVGRVLGRWFRFVDGPWKGQDGDGARS